MRGLGYRLTDALVIAACSLAFIAVISPGRYEPKNPPITLDLGTTPEHFRQVPEKSAPRHLSGPPPTDAEKEEQVPAGSAEAVLAGRAPG